MGLRDLFRAKALHASTGVLESAQDRRLNLSIKLGQSQQVRNAWMYFQSASYGWLYGHQPAVRKVVDYIASNMAQVGLKLYERIDDNDREQRGDHPAAELMRHPNPWTPEKRFIYDVFADFLVYNNAYVIKIQLDGGQRFLLPVPASAVAVQGTGVSQVAGYTVYRTDGSTFFVPPEEMIHWRGYDAADRVLGISKLETLRNELSEQAATQRANVDLMESGLQHRGYIKRPLEAPEWSKEGGKKRFIDDFRAAMKKADRGYPILEEGMEIAPLGISPKDAEMLESRKLFNDEVAQQYGMLHCPPEDEEERRQFYADVLPPIASSFCDHMKLQLLKTEFALDDFYFDFDFDKKQMSDNRLKALVSAAGAPIMTRNEARSAMNLPHMDGADTLQAPEDQLVVPLNVLVGGKPSPTVMPVQNPTGPSQEGDHREIEEGAPAPEPSGRALPPAGKDVEVVEPGEAVVGDGLRAVGEKALETSTRPRRVQDMARQRRRISEAQELLKREFGRQSRAVMQKAANGKFDKERWDRELSAELKAFLERAFALEGANYVSHLGGEDFDMGQVEHYIEAAALDIARRINNITQDDIDELGAPAAFERAFIRADIAGQQIGARATVRARNEAARQSPHPERRMKIWIRNTDRHKELDGKAVPLDQDWDGLSPGSEPNCGCSESII